MRWLWPGEIGEDIIKKDTIAYGPSLPAPLKNKPDDNVIVLFCSNWFAEMGDKDRGSLIGTTLSQEFANWAAIGANLWWRPNMSGAGGYDYGLPYVPFGRVMASVRHIVKNNCTGLCSLRNQRSICR